MSILMICEATPNSFSTITLYSPTSDGEKSWICSSNSPASDRLLVNLSPISSLPTRRRQTLSLWVVSAALSPNSITPTLRQSPGQVRDTNHVADFYDLCPRQVCDFVVNLSRTSSRTLSPTFPVHCNELNSIKATQTGLSRTCHGLCHKHLDMSRWFVSAIFVICVGDFQRNFMVSWFVTVSVRDFHDFCPRLSLWRSFGESRRNGMWASSN